MCLRNFRGRESNTSRTNSRKGSRCIVHLAHWLRSGLAVVGIGVKGDVENRVQLDAVRCSARSMFGRIKKSPALHRDFDWRIDLFEFLGRRPTQEMLLFLLSSTRIQNARPSSP